MTENTNKNVIMDRPVTEETLVRFENVHTYFQTEAGIVKAVNGVSYSIRKGETVGVVGESGCGKSVTAMSLMGLIQAPQGRVVEGSIYFDGKDVTKFNQKEFQDLRGDDVAMIFQEPMTSLNPVFRVGDQIMEAIILHQKLDKKAARAKAIEMISLVGIPRANEIVDCYPHELSGGMRQRIMIAMALSCNPRLLIADEPTTALDVTIQAQILDLMRDIKKKLGTSIMLITHDLGVVAEMADHVVVMYAGKVIEQGDVRSIFKNPQHPYTIGLLNSKPVVNQRKEKLYSIPGQVPNPIGMPDNCYFNERCPYATDICRSQIPQLEQTGETHYCACFHKEREAK